MAFLNKKEQSLIKLINTNASIPAVKRADLVKNITYNARLRQDGFRIPVREFLRALTNHNSSKIMKTLNNS